MQEEISDQQPLPRDAHEGQTGQVAPLFPQTPPIIPKTSPPVAQAARRGRLHSFLLVTLVGIVTLAVLAGGTGLLDGDFSTVVKAVRLGHRIYANIRPAMTYILAIHVPIAGISLLPPSHWNSSESQNPLLNMA